MKHLIGVVVVLPLALAQLSCAVAPERPSSASVLSAYPGLSPSSYVPTPSRASQGKAKRGIEVGYRGGLQLADGEPYNDYPSPLGLFTRIQMRGPWWLEFGLEYAAGDFEAPAKLVGITQDPNVGTIDADSSSTNLLASVQRVYSSESSRNEWFWQAGLGLSMVDVDDATGDVDGGGTFRIKTDADTEILAAAGGGYRRRLSDRWSLETLVRYDRHFADWSVKDEVSGATGSVDDYSSWALLFGFSYGIR